MKKLKRFGLVILILATAFFVYVEVVNRNTKNMTYRQKMLKAVYPAWMWITRLTGSKTMVKTHQGALPKIPFYSLQAESITGDSIHFDQYRGRKILLVNTASDCGYTAQYEDLQKLYEEYSGKLVILGFPSNDFKEQEKGTEAEIAAFCKMNYGVSFPLMKKTVVSRGPDQHPVYRWLTDPQLNGWNDKAPSWNFSKYLVDENGVLTHYFDPSVSPLNTMVKEAISQ